MYGLKATFNTQMCANAYWLKMFSPLISMAKAAYTTEAHVK